MIFAKPIHRRQQSSVSISVSIESDHQNECLSGTTDIFYSRGGVQSRSESGNESSSLSGEQSLSQETIDEVSESLGFSR